MRDLGTPVYSRRLFEEVLRTFPDRAQLHIVRLNGQPVAAGLTYRTRVDGAAAVGVVDSRVQLAVRRTSCCTGTRSSSRSRAGAARVRHGPLDAQRGHVQVQGAVGRRAGAAALGISAAPTGDCPTSVPRIRNSSWRSRCGRSFRSAVTTASRADDRSRDSVNPHHRITVSTDDRARFERRGEPVAIGVSLPRGEVLPSASWSLVDERDRHVPVQTTVLDRWGDGSVRWMLVEFQAVVPADAPSHYSLLNGSPAIGRPLTVTPSAAGTCRRYRRRTVQSCRAAARSALPMHASGIKPSLPISRSRRKMATGCPTRSPFAAPRSREAVRSSAIVLHEGNLVARDGTPWIEATVTLQFLAGLGAVRVEVSCRNPRAAQHPNGIWDLGDPGSVLIRDLSVTMRPAPRGAAPVTASLDRAQSMTPAGRRVRRLPGFERRRQLAVAQPRQPRWSRADRIPRIPRDGRRQ